jgi:hypothetical protein
MLFNCESRFARDWKEAKKKRKTIVGPIQVEVGICQIGGWSYNYGTEWQGLFMPTYCNMDTAELQEKSEWYGGLTATSG